MTEPPKREKWRPSVGLIIFTALAVVAALPLIGLFFFRLYDNQLIHQTQAELIAQSKVLAAVFAREVESRRDSRHHARRRAAARSPHRFRGQGHADPARPRPRRQ